jgi:hypothetical protein
MGMDGKDCPCEEFTTSPKEMKEKTKDSDKDVYEAIIALNKGIGRSYLYSLVQRLDWTENGIAIVGSLRLTMGFGYFSGSLLEYDSDDGKLNRMIDRPIETNAKMFVDCVPPGPNDPWVLPIPQRT